MLYSLAPVYGGMVLGVKLHGESHIDKLEMEPV